MLYSLIGLVLLLAGVAVYRYLKPAQARIAISKETTYITEPLTPLGLPDYAAYLNASMSAGVTPETNAVVKIVEALGPFPRSGSPQFPQSVSAEYHEALARELGISPLPAEGHYLIDFEKLLSEQPALYDQDEEQAYQDFYASQRIPWKTSERPEFVVWFERNEIPLQRIHEAVHRPHHYRPVILEDQQHQNVPGKLVTALSPDPQNYYPIGHALCSRAMWHLGEGRIFEALQDLQDCHRLARHLRNGWTEREFYLAVLLEGMATDGAAALAVDPRLTAEQVRSYRKELKKLGPVVTHAEFAKAVDQGKRLVNLDYMIGTALAQGGQWTSRQSDTVSGSLLEISVQRLEMNWNTTLSEMNKTYDELVAVLRIPDRADRLKAIRDFNKQIQTGLNNLSHWQSGVFLLCTGGVARGRAVAIMEAQLLIDGIEFYPQMLDAATTQWEVTQVGLALAEYHRIQGRYPERLEELQPKFLAEIPEDIFSGKPLVYQVSEDGLEMKVYSVGYNGVDDGGIRSGADSPTGQDGDDFGIVDPIPVFPTIVE